MFIKPVDITVLLLTLLVACTFAFMRIQSTLVGYEIGELKNREADLLDRLSEVKMNLAKFSSKDSLHLLANRNLTSKDPFQSLASLKKASNIKTQ